MSLPDVGPLGSLAGWFLCVFVAVGVVLMIIRGDLVPGLTHTRVTKQNDELTKKLDEQRPILLAISAGVAELSKDDAIQTDRIGFLVRFVEDTLRDRRTGHRPDA